MKSQLTRTFFVSTVLAVAVTLLLISVLSDVQQTPIRLTYSDNDKYFLNEWIEAGGGDMATSGFPESVLAQFSITERNLAPEVFFSKEFQSALMNAREPFHVTDALDSYSNQFRARLDGDSAITFSIENEKRKFAAVSRLPSPDDLPPDVLEALTLNQKQIARLNSRLSGTVNGVRMPITSTTSAFDEVLNRLIPTDQHHLEPYGDFTIELSPMLELTQETSGAERQAMLHSLFQPQEHGAHSLFEPRESLTTSRRERIPVSRLALNAIVPTVSVKQKIERSLDGSLTSLFSNEMDGVVVHPLNSADASTMTRVLSPVPMSYIRPDSENFLVRESPDRLWWRYYSRTEVGGAVMVAESDLTDAPLKNANLVIAGKDARISYLIDEDNNWTTFIAAASDSKLLRCAADGRLVGEQKETLIEFCTKIVEVGT